VIVGSVFEFLPRNTQKRIQRHRAALVAIIFAVLIPCAPTLADNGSKRDSIPKLASVDFGWVSPRDDFLPPLSGPGPVSFDPAHPYVPNGGRGDGVQYGGSQPTHRVADLSNPILKPWVVEQMKKANDAVLAGKVPFTARESCWPSGVPGFAVFSHIKLVYFIQTAKEVLMIQDDWQVRHIYLNVPHIAHPAPSWYGESIGHYENGDTLVVDTIGLNNKTFIDNYRTPHTTQLHVVERYKLVDDGKTLQGTYLVEDPGAFNMPWSARQDYHRVDAGKNVPDQPIPMIEGVCAENGSQFNYDVAPIPQADKADF
jgi:hypothetical protein